MIIIKCAKCSAEVFKYMKVGKGSGIGTKGYDDVSTKEFIGKSKSLSYRCGQIYDGTFPQKLIAGDGVTAALLKRNGSRIVSEGEA
jgi:Uncharacterized conserved protein